MWRVAIDFLRKTFADCADSVLTVDAKAEVKLMDQKCGVVLPAFKVAPPGPATQEATSPFLASGVWLQVLVVVYLLCCHCDCLLRSFLLPSPGDPLQWPSMEATASANVAAQALSSEPLDDNIEVQIPSVVAPRWIRGALLLSLPSSSLQQRS